MAPITPQGVTGGTAECSVLCSAHRPRNPYPPTRATFVSQVAVHSYDPQITRKGKVMKILSCGLLPIASMAFVLVGCLDSFASRYTVFSNLNQSSVNVGASWTKLGTGAHSFNKYAADTKIEVRMNSRISVGTLSSESHGVRFEVRVDDIESTIQNQGSVVVSNSSEFVPIFAVFDGLAVGSHTVSVWAYAANEGSATDVGVDAGGWGGTIIVKETR